MKPVATGSYTAQASHIATDRWNRFRACTGGFGSERRIASRSASFQRRATDHSGLSSGTQTREPVGRRLGLGATVGPAVGLLRALGVGPALASPVRLGAGRFASQAKSNVAIKLTVRNVRYRIPPTTLLSSGIGRVT